ncbi:MAG: carboxypeptidase regulatory-like domain-containing protein [Gemmatimonadota bacterium]
MATLRICAVALAGALAAAPTLALTQQIALRATPGSLVGVVSDTTGTPIDADVWLGGNKRRMTTGPDGRFRFENVTPGKHTIAARRVGFYPRTATIAVPDSGVIVLMQLIPLPNQLPTVVTSAVRGGLSGMIGDASFHVLKDATIEVVAANRRATSDSAGEFFIDLKPGKHMVRVSRPGFAGRFVSVTVPRDSGRRMQVWLTPSTRDISTQDSYAAMSLESRIMRRNPVYSALLTREDMERLGQSSLQQLSATLAVQRVDDRCMVTMPAFTDPFTDMARVGETAPGMMPVWALDAADLEFLEVYVGKASRNTQRSIARGPVRASSMAPASCPTIIAWLRK